jgi:hypothetical protein
MKLSELRAGSIGVVIDSGSRWEKKIERFTGQGHHVFCYHGKGLITEAHMGTKIEVKPIDPYFNDKMLVLMLEPKRRIFADCELEQVCARWTADIGKGYDTRNVLGFAFKLLQKKDDRSRFCSEHAAYGYKGLHKFRGKDYHNCSPHDILMDSWLFAYDKFKAIRLIDLQ